MPATHQDTHPPPRLWLTPTVDEHVNIFAANTHFPVPGLISI